MKNEKEMMNTWSISGKPQDPCSNLQGQSHSPQVVLQSDMEDSRMELDQASEDVSLHTTNCKVQIMQWKNSIKLPSNKAD